MGRRSNIELADPRVKAEIDRLLTAGRHTLDDIVEHLQSMGADGISRSGLHRYATRFQAVSEKLRQSREMAAAFAEELGAVEDTEGHQVISQMMQALLMRAGMEALEEEAAPDSKDLMQMAQAIQKTMQSVAQREKLIEAVERKVREAAADTAGKAAKAAGISADTVQTIRHAILGVTPDAGT